MSYNRIAKCINDPWPWVDAEGDTVDTRRHPGCWLTRENAELGVIFLRPLTLLNYLFVISLSLFPSPPLCLCLPLGRLMHRSCSLWQSITEAARFTTCQVPYLRPRVSNYWFSGGHLIHFSQKPAGINTEVLRYYAQHLQNIYTFPPHYIDTLISKSTGLMQLLPKQLHCHIQKKNKVYTDTHFYDNALLHFKISEKCIIQKKKRKKSFTCTLTYKLWAQSPSPLWGLWWCGKHHSWQEQRSHKVVCIAHEGGLSLSRSAAYDLDTKGVAKKKHWLFQKISGIKHEGYFFGHC